MDRLKVLCFAGTYGLALLCELARFVVRSPVRWYLTVGPDGPGLAGADGLPGQPGAQGADDPAGDHGVRVGDGAVVDRRADRPVPDGPLAPAGRRRACSCCRWCWVWWSRPAGSRPESRTGWMGRDDGLLGDGPRPLPAGRRRLHLRGVRRRADVPGPDAAAQAQAAARVRVLRLPSLEQSERVNRGAITLAFPLLTFGLLIGVVLSLGRAGLAAGDQAADLSWTDPKVVSALGMWLVFAVLLHARFRPAMRGRSVMVLTIVAFAFLVFTWVGVEALQPAHGPRRAPRGGEGAVRLLALGVDHRSAPAASARPWPSTGPSTTRGWSRWRRPSRATSSWSSPPATGSRSTCAGSPETVPEAEALTDFLVDFHGVRSELFAGHLVSYHDEGAVGHLFRVAASLESLVLGEGQILGPGPRGLPRGGRAQDGRARSSTRSSRRRSRSARRCASRPAWTRASSRSPASPSTWPGRSSTPSPTRPCWSSAPARWAT